MYRQVAPNYGKRLPSYGKRLPSELSNAVWTLLPMAAFTVPIDMGKGVPQMAEEQGKPDDLRLRVNISNQLVRMAHGLTLSEKRVIAMCLARLDSTKQERGRYSFELRAMDFAQQFDLTDNAAYMQLKEVGDRLLHRIAQEVIQTPKGRLIRKWQWVSLAEYQDGLGLVRLTFNDQMTPHLVMLKKEFTSYRLSQASALRSLYSWRVFELLMQFKRTGLLRISVEDFCHAVEAPATAQSNFGELRRRIIEPAVAELTAKNGLQISWSATKAGKKVSCLEFNFSVGKPSKKASEQGLVAVASETTDLPSQS